MSEKSTLMSVKSTLKLILPTLKLILPTLKLILSTLKLIFPTLKLILPTLKLILPTLKLAKRKEKKITKWHQEASVDFIAISKCGSDFRSRTFTQYEARAKRSHAQNKQCHNHP